jgi:two-component system, cell cycle sensor histidine kinase and response regulator CckA
MIRILIADDKEEALYYLQKLLGGHGYTVEVARHGAEALVKARQSPPDLIISDLLMPVMDGYTLLRHWKDDARLKQIPFIVYTATYTDPKDEQLALDLGADAFILKPAEPEALLGRIRAVLAAGHAAPLTLPQRTEGEEKVLLKEYSEVLVHKLEEKALELEQTNRALEADIVERRRAEQNIQRLNRVYSVLSAVNHAIVREKDPQVMLEAVCRIAVENGKFRMAWIGKFNPETQKLKVITSSGVVDGYTDLVRIDLRDSTNTTGPGVRCLLTGEHAICNDIANDPLYPPWREEAIKRGYQSTGGFPIKVDGQVVGVFSLYADEPGFFNEEELRLLDELAMDISFGLDVSRREQKRRKTEEELRWRTAFFEAQVDAALDGILVVDSQGNKILQNQRMNDVWKIPPHIAESKDDALQIKFVSSQTKNPKQFIEKVANLNSHPDQVSRDEIEMMDGKILDRYSSPVRDKAGNYYGRIWTFRDITEKRQLEQQFRQSQKMEAIGQLAGGVAHDFNNILATIMMEAELAVTETNVSAESRVALNDIRAAAERAANLTRQLLAFSRRQVMQTRLLDLNEIVTSLSKMLQRILGEDVSLQLNLHPRSLMARADAGMLDQVLLNLVVNARDAMPKGGKLTIETAERFFAKGEADLFPDTTVGRHVCLSVTDTGCGMSPEIRAHLFEPFFTTKEPGKGTGLGLATVFGIVKQHGGTITVSSHVGEGTTFHVFLPAEETAGRGSTQQTTMPKARGGTETILLVEDETSVRRLTRIVLERAGYHVLEAHNGVEAMQLWELHQDTIQLLFTDIMMPEGVSGHDLAARLLARNPRLSVIFTSGYSAEIAGRELSLKVGQNFIQKPALPSQLLEIVRQCLDSQTGTPLTGL